MASSFHSFMPTSSHSSSSSFSSCASSSSVIYVCPHLALGSCSCSTQVTKKRKRGHQETNKTNNVSSSHSSASSSSLSSCVSSSSSVIYVCPHLALASCSCSCSTQVTKKRKRAHQETKKNNNASSSLLDISSYPKTIVCLHLSLSVCTCLHDTQIVKNQKRVQQETNVSTTNSTCTTVGTSSDCSTTVDDSWMIKKVLTKSDLDDNCRLLLNRDLAKKWVVPVVDKAKAANEGDEVEVFDVDTGFPYSLTFKIRPSNDSHVFNNTWITDFVDRRILKKGDEIGLKWNEEKKRFDFSVLHRSDDN